MDDIFPVIDTFIDEFAMELPSMEDLFNPWDSGNASGDIFGTPVEDTAFWQQQGTPFTCAVVSQKMILDQFGIDVSESQLVYDATSNGWLTDGGTSPSDMANLLELYGVDTHSNVDAGINDIMRELAHGRKVMVAVDSGELWSDEGLFNDLVDGGFGADHAIVVSGIDFSDPNSPQVVVNDPGDPSGAGRMYPMDQFMDAWSDSQCHYVATNDSPAGLAGSLLGSEFNPEMSIYMTSEFWNEIGVDLIDAIEVGIKTSGASFAYTGSVEAALLDGVGITVIHAGSNIFETISDAQRNDLFQTI